jgi:exo-beta-1,3-glucanase (GH17 family)
LTSTQKQKKCDKALAHKFKKYLKDLKRPLGNILQNVLYFLVGLGLCAGSIAFFYVWHYVFSSGAIPSVDVTSNPWLAFPLVIVLMFFSLLAGPLILIPILAFFGGIFILLGFFMELESALKERIKSKNLIETNRKIISIKEGRRSKKKILAVCLLILIMSGVTWAMWPNSLHDSPLYTLTINSNDFGTTNPAPNTYSFTQGTEVTISSIPDSGCVFVRWEGDTSGNQTTITILMNTNKTVNATFAQIFKPANKIHGVDFSPYIGDDQKPGSGVGMSEQQIKELIMTVKPYTHWVRTFGCTDGLEVVGKIAHEQGLKVAVGAWLSKDLSANQIEISNLITIARAGQADMLIVGSEVLLRDDLTETQLIWYINQVKNATSNIPVGTADSYKELLAHPNVTAASDVILPNIYPYWEGKNVSYAISFVNLQYQNLQNASGNKPIVISESGWPSAGNQIEDAVPSQQNAAYYFLNFVSWARTNNISFFYFEAFDEAWKAVDEGPQGASWGIWNKNGQLKPGMQDVFDGKLIQDNWNDNVIVDGPGTPSIKFTSVPLIGSEGDLHGQVSHIAVKDYRVALYIKVAEVWWTKPTFVTPLVAIQTDGSWICDITTGGADANATEIAAYLVPVGYMPPLMNGESGILPAELEENAVANCRQTRIVNNGLSDSSATVLLFASSVWAVARLALQKHVVLNNNI